MKRPATWKLAVPALFVALPASADIITTTQSGISQIEVNNIRLVENSNATTNGRVSVFAIDGTRTTHEARTAARSSSTEIAANARIDAANFSPINYSTVLSQASYVLQLAPDNVFVRNAAVDFVLPPSYLEITANTEFPTTVLSTVFLGDLRVCFAVACTLADSVFHIQANLEASYRSEAHSANATGNPQLDLTSLNNPVLDTIDGVDHFLRTYHLGFPLFQGHLDLGTIPAGSPATLEYILQARASGIVADSIAISSVNDPFVLETDPVQAFAPLTFVTEILGSPPPSTGVPNPATLLLVISGLAGFGFSRGRIAACQK